MNSNLAEEDEATSAVDVLEDLKAYGIQQLRSDGEMLAGLNSRDGIAWRVVIEMLLKHLPKEPGNRRRIASRLVKPALEQILRIEGTA